MSTQRRRVLGGDGGITTITDNGVYIEGLNGKFYTVDNWQGGNDANSLIVTSGDVKFRIALTQPSSAMPFHSKSTEPFETYMTGTTSSEKALSDYNGKGNTENILKLQSGTTYAAGYCNAFIFPDGKTRGYLPSIGQLNLVYQNKSAVDAALSVCDGTPMDEDTNNGRYWSSTLWGRSSSLNRYFWLFYWAIGEAKYGATFTEINVRPFANLT